MKRILMVYMAAVLTGLFISQGARAGDRTVVHDIRRGVHPDHTRLVLDSEGARPLRIGPASADGITLQYEDLDFLVRLESMFQDSSGLIGKVSHRKEQNASVISISFRHPNTRVKTYLLSSDPVQNGGYRLVLDFYPPAVPGAREVSPSNTKTAIDKTSQQHSKTLQGSDQGIVSTGLTVVHDIRRGVHPDYTRLVLDSEGARPIRIGPASADGIALQYEGLDCRVRPESLFQDSSGLVGKVSHRKERNTSVISVTFRHPNTRVKTYFLSADPVRKGHYRLVIDLYPPGGSGTQEVLASDVVTAPGEALDKPMEDAEPRVQEAGSPQAGTVRTDTASKDSSPPKEGSARLLGKEKTAERKLPSPGEDRSADKSSFSGQVGITPRYVRGEDDSAKAQEYKDLKTPVFGDLSMRHEKKDGYFAEATGENMGRDDQRFMLGGGRYGRFKVEGIYDEIPHSFAFDAKNIYSGAGSGTLTLGDRQDVAFADRAARLNSLMATGGTIDVELKRKKAELNADLLALDPFNFRVEMGRERKEGTRPFFGPFGLENTVEIPAPVNFDTTELRATGEYAKKPLHLNLSYTLSLFRNNIGTLTWDNPFRATDAVLNPSKGLIDLAPDNESHSLAASGSLTSLPLNSVLSFVTSWSQMRQHDDLVPFTTNTAITTPSLPENAADADVNTALYQVLFTSRPLKAVHLKAKLRYFEYDNKTRQIYFPSFVNADSNLVFPDAPGATSIVNLPTSYDRTTALVDLGFDLGKNTRLTLGSKFERTHRENREVASQDDRVFKGAIDTRPFSWATLGASYERTLRDIGEYNFDIYLRGGQNLFQLPTLRKYDEADMVRDRVEINGTLYPLDALALRGSATYGADEFKDSPYGLLEDRHYIFSLDADYSATDRVIFHAFYVYENYKNRQKDKGEVPSSPPVDADWFSRSEDVVNTIGAELQFKLIPQVLDLDLTYSLSDVDGNIDFYTPAASIAEFSNADDARLYMLGAKLNYQAWKNCLLTFGYLWEKLDYGDFNVAGFTNVPVDSGGNFNGAYLMGTLPKGYSSHVVYLRIAYRF